MSLKNVDVRIEYALEENAKKPALTDPGLASPIDRAEERRLIRKIDMRIIPFICITYLVTYIDKATLGYAAVFGLRDDLKLHGLEYSWLGSIFYFGYLFFEYPTCFAMQKVSVPKWLAANIFIWGGITMAQGGTHNFSQIAALRFLLGVFESCSTPAYLLLTSMWYRVEEQPIRIGWWSTFLGLANACGGLLAFGIGRIHGELESWRYLFIIIGAVSSIWGLVMFFTLAENPQNAKWLNEAEKQLALDRLGENQTKVKTTEIKKYQVYEALLDPKTWLICLLSISTQVVNGSVSNFGSLIVKGFGYSGLNATLMQVPYGFVILFANLSAMYVQRWLPGEKRCLVAACYVLPALAGIIGIHLLPRDKKIALLVCYWLTATYTASFAMIMSLITANTGGSTKRTVINAAFFVSYCVGNIIGPFAFKASEAPVYQSGIIAVLVAFVAEIGLLLVYAMYAAFLNKKKRTQAEQMLGSDEDRTQHDQQDLTDGENVHFRFSY